VVRRRVGELGDRAVRVPPFQEAITLTVFVPFAVYYMRQPLKLDYLWAGLCIMGAVYFIFRSAP
jgi:uncharacterized protein